MCTLACIFVLLYFIAIDVNVCRVQVRKKNAENICVCACNALSFHGVIIGRAVIFHHQRWEDSVYNESIAWLTQKSAMARR